MIFLSLHVLWVVGGEDLPKKEAPHELRALVASARDTSRVVACFAPPREPGMPSTRDKYGTGVGSHWQYEAPMPNPKRFHDMAARRRRDVGNATFRQRAELAKTALRQVCCSSQRLEGHGYVLMVGDSQVQEVYEHLCDAKTKGTAFLRGRNDGPVQSGRLTITGCIASRTLLVFVAAAGKWAKHFPSFYTADVVLKRLLFPIDTQHARPSAIVTNFAAPHLLHVHPARPLFDADDSVRPHCYPQSTCADFRGLTSLEQWISNDAARYREKLGKSTRLVLVTPNWICDEKLYASYKRQLRIEPLAKRWHACAQWMMARGGPKSSRDGAHATFRGAAMGAGRAAAAAETNDAITLCESSTFSASGTMAMARRMRNAAEQVGARLLDATALTYNQCNSTLDARHYPPLVPTEVQELMRQLSK